MWCATAVRKRGTWLGYVAKRPQQPAGPLRRVRPTSCNPVTQFNNKRTHNFLKLGVREPLNLVVTVDYATLEMEVDTGAAASVISKEMYECLWGCSAKPTLKRSNMLLRTYTGERLKICGLISFKCEIQ